MTAKSFSDLASPDGVGGLPLVSIAGRIRVVASAVAAKSTEALLHVLVLPSAESVLTNKHARGDGSAGEFVRSALFGVIGGIRSEADVVGAAL